MFIAVENLVASPHRRVTNQLTTKSRVINRNERRRVEFVTPKKKKKKARGTDACSRSPVCICMQPERNEAA